MGLYFLYDYSCQRVTKKVAKNVFRKITKMFRETRLISIGFTIPLFEAIIRKLKLPRKNQDIVPCKFALDRVQRYLYPAYKVPIGTCLKLQVSYVAFCVVGVPLFSNKMVFIRQDITMNKIRYLMPQHMDSYTCCLNS